MAQPAAGNNITVQKGINWSPLIKLEDWWAVWFGFILIILAASGIITKIPGIAKWTSLGQALPAAIWPQLLLLLVGLGILTAIGVKAMGENVGKYLGGFVAVFILAVVAQLLASHNISKSYNLEVPLWGLIVGLIISNTLRTPGWVRPAVKTEMFIKTGLVLLGCEILFNRIVALGVPGLVVAWVGCPIVLIFTYWFGVKLMKLKPELAMTMSAAASVCGVSAAIATGAACDADKEEVSVAITISLIFTVIMLVVMPLFIMGINMDPDVGAAWIGGTIDATGAVVAAGAFLGQRGLEVASVVKMVQNVLIGVVAFFVALIWATRMGGSSDAVGEARAKVIWDRFPKFVLGFVAASLLFSFILVPTMGAKSVDGVVKLTSGLRGWLFAMAFVCIGLEANFRDLLKQVQGGKSVLQYIIGQLFNVVLTLFLAWLAFGGILFPKAM